MKLKPQETAKCNFWFRIRKNSKKNLENLREYFLNEGKFLRQETGHCCRVFGGFLLSFEVAWCADPRDD